MGSYVLGFQEIDLTEVAVVGGKAAHLGELARIAPLGPSLDVGLGIRRD